MMCQKSTHSIIVATHSPCETSPLVLTETTRKENGIIIIVIVIEEQDEAHVTGVVSVYFAAIVKLGPTHTFSGYNTWGGQDWLRACAFHATGMPYKLPTETQAQVPHNLRGLETGSGVVRSFHRRMKRGPLAHRPPVLPGSELTLFTSLQHVEWIRKRGKISNFEMNQKLRRFTYTPVVRQVAAHRPADVVRWSSRH